MGKAKFEQFGNYVLLEKLASGGMAEVFLAKRMGASGVQKFIAVKRILPQFSDSEEFVQMFKDEAKIAVNLSHSNVISIHDFGVEMDQFFLVMEYCEGRNLRQILNKMKKSNLTFSISQIVYMVKEVAAGLDHAHRCLDGSTGKPLNITHRDMSPQNVMISFEGETKIVDFGIAKASTQIETTRAGTLKGKFGYMSPEQAEGLPVDFRTDIFSLGIVLWELLANDRLFVANNEINTLRKIRECNIPSLRKINPNIPPELEKICSKSLAKDRNLRYQSAAAFHRDLNRFLNRHDPDFSPHDFSVFIKTLFANEILETRKKLVQYAQYQPPNRDQNGQYQSPNNGGRNNRNVMSDDFIDEQSSGSEFNNMFDEKSKPATNQNENSYNVSESSYQTSTENSAPYDVNNDSNTNSYVPNAENKVGTITDLENQRQLAQINNMNQNKVFDMPTADQNSELQGLEEVPEDQIENSKPGNNNSDKYTNFYANTGIQIKSGGTATNITYGSYTNTAYQHNRPNMFLRLVLTASLVVVGIMSYVYYKANPEKVHSTVTNICIDLSVSSFCSNYLLPSGEEGSTMEASVGVLEVTSNPPGAQIIVDDEIKGITPKKIAAKDKFTLTVKMNGYFPFQKYYEVAPSDPINAELIKTKAGYLTVRLVGVSEVDVYVNGEKVIKLDKIPVRAGKPTQIRAVNRITKGEQATTVIVGENKVKKINLTPF